MATLRSRRLETLLGATLDNDSLRAGHVRRLVEFHAEEAFDLDFKKALYGRTDADKRALAATCCDIRRLTT
jgi:hypothetical protein